MSEFNMRNFALIVASIVLSLGCGAHSDRAMASGSSYRTEEVRFATGSVTLAGAIYAPTTGGRHPAIVLLHGSGPETRADLQSYAKWFASRGLVVAVYDKRGTGRSSGNWQLASYQDLGADALSAVGVLKKRADVDAQKIGLFGPSEGGWVAPLAATESSDIAFLILKSAIGVTPERQMQYAWTNALRRAGAPSSTIATVDSARLALWTYARDGSGREAAEALLARAKRSPGFPADPETVGLVSQVPPPSMLGDSALAPKLFFVRVSSRFDPRPVLENVHVPTLAIFGDADSDTPVRESVDAFRAAFARGRNPDLQIIVIPGADHYLEREGASGDRTAPEFFAAIDRWISEHLM
jgi:uncharacterized protein